MSYDFSEDPNLGTTFSSWFSRVLRIMAAVRSRSRVVIEFKVHPLIQRNSSLFWRFFVNHLHQEICNLPKMLEGNNHLEFASSEGLSDGSSKDRSDNYVGDEERTWSATFVSAPSRFFSANVPAGETREERSTLGLTEERGLWGSSENRTWKGSCIHGAKAWKE